jgi:hypothetical protein
MLTLTKKMEIREICTTTTKNHTYFTSNINSLFGHFEYGTYLGHQIVEFLGYAEYSIYLFPKLKTTFLKHNDINKAKDFISQGQLIEDEK